MAEVIRMPLLSDTMKEGVIANWNKQVGDPVKSDDAIADVETDKATMEVIPYVEGTLLYIGIEKGKAAKVNEIIAIIGKPGEDISAYLNESSPADTSAPVATPSVGASSSVVSTTSTTTTLPKELTVIRMPLLSDTMKEGKIISWNKSIGDAVKADDSLADVETDKATMEVVGYAEGTLLYQGVPAGQAAKVNDVIAVVGPSGTDLSPYLDILKSSGLEEVVTQPAPAAAAPGIQVLGNSNPISHDESGRIRISPLARQMAKEKGIDVSHLQGSGDDGRIVKRDIENYKPQTQPVASGSISPSVTHQPQGIESHTDVPLTQMRKVIAQRLGESKFSAPHFYLKITVEMDALMQARQEMNQVSPVKISFNDILIKAVSLSLRQHPDVNSSWMGDFIRFNHHIHIGSAIALEDGLIVPVIRFADQKSLSQIASDASDLYEKARTKKLQPQEFSGNTFTISNLGMMDIDEFTAIINPPDACILAVGRIASTPVVKQGTIEIKNLMKLTLSCDHRVVDGAVGARFLQTLKSYLEKPATMLV